MMANNRELAAYIMEQLTELGEVRNIPMMGGYIFYYRERTTKKRKTKKKE